MPSKPLLECYKNYEESVGDGDRKLVVSTAINIMESGEFDPDGFQTLCNKLPQFQKTFILKVLKEVRSHQKENAPIYFIAEGL